MIKNWIRSFPSSLQLQYHRRTVSYKEEMAGRSEARKKVHRHFPGKYYSVPNVPAILLGRVDLRVDRQQFRNNIKIQDSLWVVSYVSLSRIGTGRHGGRPSQEPEANPAAYRTTRRSSLSRAHRKKKISASARDHSARKATAHTGLPWDFYCESVASGSIPRFVALSPSIKPVATNSYPQRTIF